MGDKASGDAEQTCTKNRHLAQAYPDLILQSCLSISLGSLTLVLPLLVMMMMMLLLLLVAVLLVGLVLLLSFLLLLL